MILCFPDLDTFRLVVTSSVLPPAVTLADADVVTADDGRVFVDTPQKLTRKVVAELAKLNVDVMKTLPGEPQRVSCWLQVIPVSKDAGPPNVPSNAPVLFELPSARELPGIVSEMLRLGNDRQSYRWVAPVGDPTDRRVLLRVISPPYYTLLRALDRHVTTGGGPVRAYAEQAPQVWVEVGHTHPLASQITPAEGQIVLIRGPREWTYLPDLPFRDVYDLIRFELPHAAVEWQPVADAPPIAVPLRLTAGDTSDGAELWVLRGDADARLDQFVREADERTTQRLRFAVADSPGGGRVIVLKLGTAKGTPPAVSLPTAVAYKSHPSLPNLFIPVGKRLHPQLRRDTVRGLLAEDVDSVVWLNPTGDGGFTPESVADEAFHPLEDWVEYVIESAHVPLQAWVESVRFEFGGFVCGDERPAKPKDPGRGPRERTGKDANADALSVPTGPKPGPGAKGEPAGPSNADYVVPVEQKKPNEWKVRRELLQTQFLALDGPLDHPERVALWPQLAVANAGAGDAGEAALCWASALWSAPRAAVDCAAGWARTEFPQSDGLIEETEFARRLRQPDPLQSDVRQFAAAVLALAVRGDRPGWFTHRLADVQQYFETNEPKMSVRAAWLVATHLARLSGADVLGVARMRDRLLMRLLEVGLNPELDLPFFLRTAGLEDSDRVRMVRDEVGTLHKLLRQWADQGSKTGQTITNVESNPTASYVDLMFAYGMARLGESQAAARLVETARAAFDKYPPDNKIGIGSRFLFRAFRYRVDQALKGQPLSGRLPPPLLDELEDINKKSKGVPNSPFGEVHYAISRMQQQSMLLEPYEQPNPYKKFTVDHQDELAKQLHTLAAEKDPQRLVTKIRTLYRDHGRKPEAKDRGKQAGPPTENQFKVLLETLPLSARCGGSFAAELIQLVPDALRQNFPQMPEWVEKQGRLLERGLFLAGHFDHRELVGQLVDVFIEVVANKPTDHQLKLLNVVAGQGVRSLRKLGLRDDIDRLLRQLMAAVLGDATVQDLKARYAGKSDQWVKALQAMLHLAGGWLSFGLTDRANPILDEARSVILASGGGKPVLPIDFTSLVRAYISAVGHGPAEEGLQRITELFRGIEPGKITNRFTSNQFYSRLHLAVVEEVVLAVVSDDFALGTTGRRWLEEDEFLVRRRIHDDMRSMLAGSGL